MAPINQVRIASQYKDHVQRLLTDRLQTTPIAAGSILNDLRLAQQELYGAKDNILAFPSPRSLVATPAARFQLDGKLIWGSRLFEDKVGLNEKFYTDLYDVFVEAADESGDSEAIDTDTDLASLENGINQFLEDRLEKVGGEVRDAIAATAEEIIEHDSTKITAHSKDGIIYTKITGRTPITAEDVAWLLCDEAAGKAVPPLEALYGKVIDRTAQAKNARGKVIEVTFNAKGYPFANPQSYIEIWKDRQSDGTLLVHFKMRKAAEIGLPALEKPIKSMEATFRLRPENGYTHYSLESAVDPDIFIPAWLMSWGPLGIPQKFKDATVQIAQYLGIKNYYDDCISQERNLAMHGATTFCRGTEDIETTPQINPPAK